LFERSERIFCDGCREEKDEYSRGLFICPVGARDAAKGQVRLVFPTIPDLVPKVTAERSQEI